MPGFDQDRFVDLTEREANHLICCICLNIYDNAVNSECGHSFCKGCVKQLIQYQRQECPQCKIKFTRKRASTNETLIIIDQFVFKPNFTANGIISQLKTKCEFQFNGCKEVIEMGLMSAHLKTCEHRLCQKCGDKAEPPDVHTCLSPQEKSRASVDNCIDSLVHSAHCSDAQCQLVAGKQTCHKMKLVIQHAKTCKIKQNPSQTECPICKHLFTLCCYHAKKCQRDDCTVPYCPKIKRKLKGKTSQESTQVSQMA